MVCGGRAASLSLLEPAVNAYPISEEPDPWPQIEGVSFRSLLHTLYHSTVC